MSAQTSPVGRWCQLTKGAQLLPAARNSACSFNNQFGIEPRSGGQFCPQGVNLGHAERATQGLDQARVELGFRDDACHAGLGDCVPQCGHAGGAGRCRIAIAQGTQGGQDEAAFEILEMLMIQPAQSSLESLA